MNDLQKDIFVGLLFVMGIFGFASGLFVASAVVFALSAIFSNMRFTQLN